METVTLPSTWYTRVLPLDVGVMSCFLSTSSSCCLRASTCGSRGLLPLQCRQAPPCYSQALRDTLLLARPAM